jgi:hypothetical protein
MGARYRTAQLNPVCGDHPGAVRENFVLNRYIPESGGFKPNPVFVFRMGPAVFIEIQKNQV